jgi:8-oxo-dGTP pyrophosphatase MutT (NUDIX family)
MSPRLAVRALIIRDNRLLLVNAYPGQQSDLWCAPGGGVERGQSLPDNLIRELHEELGVAITVGAPCLVNEFHDPTRGFHQVDVYFHAQLATDLPAQWRDTQGVVNRLTWASPDDLTRLRHKPDSLRAAAFGPPGAVLYDPLELIVR